MAVEGIAQLVKEQLDKMAGIANGAASFAHKVNDAPELSKDTAAIVIQLNNVVQSLAVLSVLIAVQSDGIKVRQEKVPDGDER